MDLIEQQTIPIPRILVVPKGEVRSRFNPFTLELGGLRYQPISDELRAQHLRTGVTETLVLGRGGVEEARLEDYVVGGLVDFDDVSYDDHADLLYDLAAQTVAHFRAYLRVPVGERHRQDPENSPTRDRAVHPRPDAEPLSGGGV